MAVEQATILCVDDDEINRMVFSAWLRRAGYCVLEAETAAEALAAVATACPDLVVLDVNLPDLSGFEVCRRLRLLPGSQHTMVLFISAIYIGVEDRTTGLEQGADGYLTKPIQERELAAQVRAMLRMQKAEAASRLAAQQWRATFDAIGDPVCLLDAEGRVLRGNRALAELAGLDFDVLVGEPLRDVLARALTLPADADIPDWGRVRERHSAEHQLGGRWFRASSDPLLDDNGFCRSTVLILADITDRKRLEESLDQARHLESIGRVAGGVAHEFNNLLTAILGNASLLQRGANLSRESCDLVASIERSAWRAAELTRQLLGFSGQTLLWLRPVDPKRLLADVERIMRPHVPAGVRLTFTATPNARVIRADADQLQQVLLQLARNAFEAMPDGGEVRITADNVDLLPVESADAAPSRVGPFVRLAVADDGVGIAPEILGRIFDPFFTTKPVGQGSGLGLAMAHGLVHQHNGWIECTSAPGKGSRFDIFLPRESSAPGIDARPRASSVLVADENPILRNLASAYLREAGHDVLTAGTAAETCACARRAADRLAVIVLEGHLVHSTPELLADVRRLVPDAVFVVASEHHAPGDAVTGDFVPVARPYRGEELVAAVRSAVV